jgi:hypothetical protein
MTIKIKPTSTTATIEHNDSTILTIDSSGNIDVPNKLTSSGGIVQVQHTVDKTHSSNAVSTTWEELSTNFRVSITPTSTDNYVMLEAWIAYSGAGTSRVWQFYFYDVTGSAGVDLGTANGSRQQALVGWRGEHYDANDSGILHLKQIVQAPRTTATTYTVYARCENNQTMYLNYTQGDSSVYGWTGSSVITATEIAS